MSSSGTNNSTVSKNLQDKCPILKDKVLHKDKILIDKELQVNQVLFTLKWRSMTQILLALPTIGLFICLITSLVFHADHINNTICDVYNFLPSISAVTGVSPQRYVWRICVALHISPRLLVAIVAKEFYTALATRVTEENRPTYLGFVTLAFCLNLTELVTLCGVTFISNKENYPVHEKLFMIFMVASLVYMVVVVRLLQMVETSLLPECLLRSTAHKKWLLVTKIAATIGLLFFFWRHRVYCQPEAFSWFSLCEYVIATSNMLFHVSVSLDFVDQHLIVGQMDSKYLKSTQEMNNSKEKIASQNIFSAVEVDYKNPISVQHEGSGAEFVSGSSCYSRLSTDPSSSSFSSSCLTETSSDSSSSSITGTPSPTYGGILQCTVIGDSPRQVLRTIDENSGSVLKIAPENDVLATKERSIISIGDKTKDQSTTHNNSQKPTCLIDKTHIE